MRAPRACVCGKGGGRELCAVYSSVHCAVSCCKVVFCHAHVSEERSQSECVCKTSSSADWTDKCKRCFSYPSRLLHLLPFRSAVYIKLRKLNLTLKRYFVKVYVFSGSMSNGLLVINFLKFILVVFPSKPTCPNPNITLPRGKITTSAHLLTRQESHHRATRTTF